MATFVERGAVKDMFGKVIDWDTDTLKYMLLTTLATDKDITTYGRGESWGGVEASGTGYTAGGATLGSLSIDTTQADKVVFDAADVSWSSSTISSVLGGAVWDDTVTTPTADPVLIHHDFSGSYSTSSGTFAVTFAAVASGGLAQATV